MARALLRARHMTQRSRRPFDRPSPAARELDRLIVDNLGFRLGPYLRKLAQASVAAAMISGCSMSHGMDEDAGPPDTVDAGPPDVVDAGPPGVDAGPPLDAGPRPSSELCSMDGQYLATGGLSPASSPDWVGALNVPSFAPGPADFLHETGTRCGTASVPATCHGEVDRIRMETYRRALLTTDGDAVTKYETAEQVQGFLGPIDTPNEAALAAWHAGYDIYCGGDFLSTVTEIAGGYRVVAYRNSGGCGSPWLTTQYTLVVSADGAVTEESSMVVREEEDWGCIGRRPAGLRADAPSRSSNAVGAFFANVTRLEASAVDAFDILIDELRSLGAPEAILEMAWEAREDEVRHTDTMGAIARRYGAEPGSGKVDPIEGRTAYEIALENAVEGCVRETFGALVGAYQAQAAQDPAIRDAMRSIADDELRHAELSWAVASWLEPQLSPDERARIAEAKREAIEALREEAAMTHDESLVTLAGLPTPDVAVAMVSRLDEELWA